MTAAVADRLYLDLKGARERLCRAQTELDPTDRVDRCRTLGNAVVPHVAEWMGRLLMAMDGAA